MKSSDFSTSKFLGYNDSLKIIINRDREILRNFNITYKQIVDRLNTITLKVKALGNNSVVEDIFKVKIVTYKGAQECPFQSQDDKKYYGYKYGNSDVKITNLKTNKSITINTLLPHMIEHHSFFEGNVLHRLEPEKVIKVLELKPEIDYSPQFNKTKIWRMFYSTSESLIIEEEDKHKYIRVYNIARQRVQREEEHCDGLIKAYICDNDYLIVSVTKEKSLDIKKIVIDDCEIKLQTNYNQTILYIKEDVNNIIL